MSANTPTQIMKKPYQAATFPLREVRTGASSGGFPHFHSTNPNIKTIPPIATPALVKNHLSSAVPGTVCTMADAAWTARTIIGVLPGSELPQGIIANQVTGGLTLMNGPAGFNNLYNSHQQSKQSDAIDDEDGVIAAKINMAASAAQAAFGTVMIGSRSTTIASVLAPTRAGLTSAAALFGFLANILMLPLFVFVGIWGAFQSHRAHKFYETYAGTTFKALTRGIYVSPQHIKNQLIKKDSVGLRLSGYSALEKAVGTNTQKICTQYSRSTPEEKKALLEHVLQEHFLKENPELLAMKEFYFSQLDEVTVNKLDLPTAIGLLLKVRKLQLKNQATAARALGSDCVEKVQRAAMRGLEARLASPSISVSASARREWSALNREVASSYAKNQKVYKATAWLGLIVTVSSLLVFFLTGPIGVAVLLGMTLLAALTSVIYDAYTQSEFAGKPGRFDKLYIGVAIGLVIASITTLSVFGGAPLVLGLSLALSIVMLLSLLHGAYKMRQQEKAWKENHPDVQDLARHLKALRKHNLDDLDRETYALFRKQPKEVRRAITDEAVKGKARERLTYERLNYADKEKLGRAVKKTTEFFWKQWWYSSNHEHFKEQALLLEELALSIEEDNLPNVKHAYRQIHDVETLDILFDHIHRVFKREESVKSLQKAVTSFSKYQIDQQSA